MQIIKLNAIDSTNNYLKQLMIDTVLEDFCVVTTKRQTKGKGQVGAEWYSEEDKNLTISVLKNKPSVRLPYQFLLNILVSLSIVKTLESYKMPKLAIKWPNDILSDHHKVSGILIENIIKSNKIDCSVIGIGLNVNQELFEGLSKVSSMKSILGTPIDKDELLLKLIKNIQIYFELYAEKGENVVVVEDLISTGKSSLVAVNALKTAEVNVKGMVAIFTYGFEVSKENFETNNINLYTLSNYESLLEQALDTNFINQNEVEILSKWNSNPSEWTGK